MYAGFWKRFAAFIIDSIIIYIVLALFFLCGILGAIFGHSDSFIFVNLLQAVIYFLGFILPILYWTLFECSSYQATPGKLLLGLRVCGIHGEKMTFITSLRRNLCKIITNMTVVIGYVMAGFTVRKQALHDKMSDCLVVTKNTDVAALAPLPKRSPWFIALVISGSLLPFFLLCALLIAGIVLAIYFTMPSSQAVAARAQLVNIIDEQKIYKMQHGSYARSFDEMPVLHDINKDNGSFTFALKDNSVTASFKKKPAFTLTACYDMPRFCIDTSSVKADGFEVAAPSECCNK